MKQQNTWIGVDLDGTLAHYEGWKGVEHVGEPLAPMVEWVQSLIATGWQVKIFTARASGYPAEVYLPPIHEFCRRAGLPELEVTCAKDFNMHALYDDRAFQVEHNTGRILRTALEVH